jgi:exonuclease III
MRLVQLNIEGSKHLEKVLPFLKEQNADVVCLQEVFEKDFGLISQTLDMKGSFFPMFDKDQLNQGCAQPNGPQGVALFSRKDSSSIQGVYYVGKGTVPKFRYPKMNLDYVLVYGCFKFNKKKFTIGTTHFVWTPNGEANNEQRKAFKKLMKVIDNLKIGIISGDFNTPRGKEMFSAFEEHFKDNIPLDIKSTLDPLLHKKPHLKLVVDTIFTKPKYNVQELEVIDGLSDHKAIVAVII